MHPNPSSSVHVFQAPPVISKTHISSATSDLVFIDIGISSHADVNVILAHTDVKVKTAGGYAGASPADSRCRLRNRYERLPPLPVASLPVGESTFRGVCFDIIRHWSLRVNPRMGTPIWKHSNLFLVSATAGEFV